MYKLNVLTGFLDLVTIPGASALLPSTTTFNATTAWTLDGADYRQTITAVTHNQGLNPLVQVFEDVAGVFNLVDTVVQVAANGDVTIRVNSSPDNRFAGKVVIG